jgi:hypothetical protein
MGIGRAAERIEILNARMPFPAAQGDFRSQKKDPATLGGGAGKVGYEQPNLYHRFARREISFL